MLLILAIDQESHNLYSLQEQQFVFEITNALQYQVLMVPMLDPRSYTCEDVIKLQCHGSEVCLRRVLRACLDAAARLAEPGVEHMAMDVAGVLQIIMVCVSNFKKWSTTRVDAKCLIRVQSWHPVLSCYCIYNETRTDINFIMKLTTKLGNALK